METELDIHRIPMQITHGCLVASIQTDLTSTVLERFRSDLLESIRATHAHAVIFDCSGLDLMDASEFVALRKCMAMAHLMGTRTILVGLNAGVASALIDMNVSIDRLEVTATLERAFSLLGREMAAN